MDRFFFFLEEDFFFGLGCGLAVGELSCSIKVLENRTLVCVSSKRGEKLGSDDRTGISGFGALRLLVVVVEVCPVEWLSGFLTLGTALGMGIGLEGVSDDGVEKSGSEGSPLVCEGTEEGGFLR